MQMKVLFIDLENDGKRKGECHYVTHCSSKSFTSFFTSIAR